MIQKPMPRFGYHAPTDPEDWHAGDRVRLSSAIDQYNDVGTIVSIAQIHLPSEGWHSFIVGVQWDHSWTVYHAAHELRLA